MSATARLRCWWRGIARRSRVSGEVEEELQFHLDAYAEDLERQGMSPAEAKRTARANLGQAHAQSEKYRDAVGLRVWDEVWSDLHYGLRGLRKNPGFGAVTVLSLALSIGMATAMFSLVHAVLLDVYPYADSDRTVNPIVFDPAHPDDWDWFVLTRAQFQTYRSSPAFEDVLGQMNLGAQIQETDGEQQANVVALTANAAQFLRVPPLIGRGLQASDGGYGDRAPEIAVLGFQFWRRQYAGDPAVLGRKLTFATGISGKGETVTIVGVMPRRFTLGGTPDFYIPMSQVKAPEMRLIAFAKLRPGVTAKQASAAVDAMMHGFAAQDPRMYPTKFETRLQPLINGFTDRSKFVRSLPILFVAVGLLLVIGCANCSILLLARGVARTHEFALRAAVGASPARLVRQLLAECLAVSLLGSLLGVGLSYFLARMPLELAKNLFPSESVVRVDVSVLTFSVVLAMAVGVLVGLWPALRFSRPQIGATLQRTSRRTASRAARAGLRRLIGGQIALTLVVVTVAGAASAAYLRVSHIQLGYNPANTTVVFAGANPTKDRTWAERTSRTGQMRDALAAVPGVVSVASTQDIPPQGMGHAVPFSIVGDPAHPASTTWINLVDAAYFSTLQIRVVAGRIWSEAEGRQGLPLAVVNETFLRRYSPNRSILNRTIELPALGHDVPPQIFRSPSFGAPEVQVVGVTADTINDGLGEAVQPEIYVNTHVLAFGGTPLLVRTEGDPGPYVGAVRHALHGAGAQMIFVSPDTLEQGVHQDETWRRLQLTAALFSIFAVAALLLALVGLYSVVVYLVAQRTQEFGIRLALGATRGHILWLVLRSNMPVVLGGTVTGLLLDVATKRPFERWLQGTPESAWLMAELATLLITVALAACLSPAGRAAMTEPNEVLRAE